MDKVKFNTLGLIISISGLLILSGCATTKGYEQRLNSWMGASEANLIRSWGVPKNVFNSGGRRYFVYNSSRNIYIPGTSPTYTTTIYGNTAYTTSSGGSSPTNINMQCETTFEIQNGRVSSWRYRGNDCKAPESPKQKIKSTERKEPLNDPHVRKSKKYYANLNLNTKEKKEWFSDLNKSLLEKEITKSTYIKKGLQRYPKLKKEFTFFANRIAG